MLVDDGTGVLSCAQWREKDDSDEGLFIPKLGQLVSVWGKVSEYRDVKQLTVTTIAEQEDPNSEPLHWLEVIHLKKTVYSRPFSPLMGVQVDTECLKDTVKETVLGFLNKFYSGKHFTLLELSGNVALTKSCIESTTNGPGACTEQEVVEEVSRLIRELPEVDAIIPALGVGKHRETKYEVCIDLQLDLISVACIINPKIRLAIL